MAERSNTTPKQGGVTGKGFTKGDPRINRKGRPRTFDAVRELAQQIAHETAKAGGSEVVIDGHRVTVTEAILRQWATSKDPRLQMAFVEYAYGKPPQEMRHTGDDGGPIRSIHEVIIGGASPTTGQQAAGAVLDEPSAS